MDEATWKGWNVKLMSGKMLPWLKQLEYGKAQFLKPLFHLKSRHDTTPLVMVNIQSNYLNILNLNKCMNGRGGLESLMYC